MVEQDPTNDVDVVKISMENPKTKRFTPATLTRDQEKDLKVQIVVLKAHFKNEVFDRKTLIEGF